MTTTGQRGDTARREIAVLARFILAGLLNTGISLVVYWLLLRVTSPQPAYAICFATGILVSFLLNTGMVFRSRRTWTRFLAFPLIYGVGYAVGAGVLALAIRRFGIDPVLAPILSQGATWPVMFVLMRALLPPDARPRRGNAH